MMGQIDLRPDDSVQAKSQSALSLHPILIVWSGSTIVCTVLTC